MLCATPSWKVGTVYLSVPFEMKFPCKECLSVQGSRQRRKATFVLLHLSAGEVAQAIGVSMRCENPIYHLIEFAAVLLIVHCFGHHSHYVLSSFYRWPCSYKLQQDHPEAVYITSIRQLLCHVVFRVQMKTKVAFLLHARWSSSLFHDQDEDPWKPTSEYPVLLKVSCPEGKICTLNWSSFKLVRLLRLSGTDPLSVFESRRREPLETGISPESLLSLKSNHESLDKLPIERGIGPLKLLEVRDLQKDMNDPRSPNSVLSSPIPDNFLQKQVPIPSQLLPQGSVPDQFGGKLLQLDLRAFRADTALEMTVSN
nr:hypothetical protein Iba_chr10fCG7400 [Ipomoea batatas]